MVGDYMHKAKGGLLMERLSDAQGLITATHDVPVSAKDQHNSEPKKVSYGEISGRYQPAGNQTPLLSGLSACRQK
jgi:hypothetical protein